MKYDPVLQLTKFHTPPYPINIICRWCGVVKYKNCWPMVHELVVEYGTDMWDKLEYETCPSCIELEEYNVYIQ